MQQDQIKWDARFASKALSSPKPPGFIVERAASLPKGKVLDVACGDGAAALYLASEAGGSHEVVAADISIEGLKRLEQFAKKNNNSVQAVQVDLDEASVIETLKIPVQKESGYSVITLCHFKPSVELLHQLLGLLKPGGQLLLSTFNQMHHEKNGFSKRFCLAPEEYLPVPKDYECLLYQSVDRNGDCMDDYCFQRSLRRY